MEKVESVNLQAVKDIECASKQVKFRAKHDNIESDDKGMRKSTKIMLGATILAATTAIGIITHRKIKAGKAAKKLLHTIQHSKKSLKTRFENVGCAEEIAVKLDEIEKLSLPEQAEALHGLEKIHANIQKMQIYGENGQLYLKRGMTDYPAEVKNAIKEGRWFDAGELYEKYVQTLPNTFRTKTTGKTVEETIANVFGKDSKIKPHTYDLSQEGEYIISERDFGGFHDHLASKEGILYERIIGDETSDLLYESISSHSVFGDRSVKTPIKEGFIIKHGVQDGKYVTILQGPTREVGTAGDKIPLRLGFISRGRGMSPAQKDLLSLAEHPEKFDASYIDKLTLRDSFDGIAGDRGIVNLDYDLAYSIIQSMARGL